VCDYRRRHGEGVAKLAARESGSEADPPARGCGKREPPVDVEEMAANWNIGGTFVAEADQVIVGEIHIDRSWMGFGEIGMMVANGWRGRGVGTALVAAAIEQARARGLHKLALSVFPHNGAAISLYRKFGFVEEGRLTKHIRRANGELWDLIEMGLLL
jgi:putative acetyltransferase